MPPLYELIMTVIVFVGGLAFVALAKPDAGTQTAIIALVTGVIGSFIRGMSSGATNVTTTAQAPTAEQKAAGG